MNFLGSFYNGISGVNAMGQRLNVTANNVSNVNTNGFKASQALFSDLLETNIGSFARGHGVQLGSIATGFSAGSLESTNKSTDMAISGTGFFMLRKADAALPGLYSRSGNFNLVRHQGPEANAYNLISPAGHFVQGYNLSATTASPNTISDVLVKSTTPQLATSHVDLTVNLENNPALTESVSTSLFDSWDGRNSASPIAAGKYDYKTTMKIYGPGNESDPITAPSYAYDLSVYFDSTSNQNQKEFLIACDPSLDQRLIPGGTSRYNTNDKGAGALLYGILHFSSNGDLSNIECWNVPPDGNVAPSDANRVNLARGESFYSFDFNFDPAAANNSSTISFGNLPRPQIITSPAASYSNASLFPTINANSSWSSVYDSAGNKINAGDTFVFTGTTGTGAPVTYSYTATPNQTVANLLSGLSASFACKAEIIDGKLTLTDSEVGTSQLAVSSISYANAAGSTPLTDPTIAQIFGNQGASFSINPESRYYGGGLATTSYANKSTTIFQNQNGYGKGRLEDIIVDSKGVIIGQYSNGQSIKQAQLALANFINLQGLQAEGSNIFVATASAGPAILGTAGLSSFGTVTNNSLEMSNVDLGREMVDLITTQRSFQANAKSISTTDELYEKLLQMIR